MRSSVEEIVKSTAISDRSARIIQNAAKRVVDLKEYSQILDNISNKSREIVRDFETLKKSKNVTLK